MCSMPRVILVVLAACSSGLAAKLPATYPRCHVNDVELDRCLAAAIETAIRSLKDGEKSLGLPPISPLFVDEITLDLGSGPIPLVINGKNLSFSGLETTSINEAHLDTDKNLLTVTSFTPHLRVDFAYSTTGRILLVAVKGDGPAFFEFDGLTTYHKMQGAPFKKKGKTYWNITDFNVDIKAEKMKCHFEGLMKGNPQVSEQVNGFLNEDWQLFFDQIKGPASESFGSIFQQFSARVFNRVPVSDIFLDI